jgi:ribosomal protein S27AE
MKSYVCPACRAESFSMHDIAHRYCGRCHRFEDDLYIIRPNRMSVSEQHRIEESLKGSKASGGAAQEAKWISEHPHGEKS